VKNEDGGRSLIHRFRGEVKVKDLSLVDSSLVISSVVIGRPVSGQRLAHKLRAAEVGKERWSVENGANDFHLLPPQPKSASVSGRDEQRSRSSVLGRPSSVFRLRSSVLGLRSSAKARSIPRRMIEEEEREVKDGTRIVQSSEFRDQSSDLKMGTVPDCGRVRAAGDCPHFEDCLTRMQVKLQNADIKMQNGRKRAAGRERQNWVEVEARVSSSWL